MHNVASTGTNAAKIWLSQYFMDYAKFAWYCGIHPPSFFLTEDYISLFKSVVSLNNAH